MNHLYHLREYVAKVQGNDVYVVPLAAEVKVTKEGTLVKQAKDPKYVVSIQFKDGDIYNHRRWCDNKAAALELAAAIIKKLTPTNESPTGKSEAMAASNQSHGQPAVIH